MGINVEGTDMEKRLKRSLMPPLHGAYSIGALAGAAIGTVAIAIGVPLPIQIYVLCVLVAVVATFVAFVAVVADVAVAAFPPIDKPEAVPVNPVPGPSNWVVAVTVVPRTVAAVVAPTFAPSIAPPVIATELAFWVDIVPRPLT